MDDNISRKAVELRINEFFTNETYTEEMLRDEIHNLPSVDVPHWIPCSKKLPEEDGEYLVTDVSGGAATVTETYFITDCEGEGHWGALDVIAWMPLPEPYDPNDNYCSNCGREILNE